MKAKKVQEKKGADEGNTRKLFTLPVKLLNEMEGLAKSRYTNVSTLARMALSEWMEARKRDSEV